MFTSQLRALEMSFHIVQKHWEQMHPAWLKEEENLSHLNYIRFADFASAYCTTVFVDILQQIMIEFTSIYHIFLVLWTSLWIPWSPKSGVFFTPSNHFNPFIVFKSFGYDHSACNKYLNFDSHADLRN